MDRRLERGLKNAQTTLQYLQQRFRERNCPDAADMVQSLEFKIIHLEYIVRKNAEKEYHVSEILKAINVVLATLSFAQTEEMRMIELACRNIPPSLLMRPSYV